MKKSKLILMMMAILIAFAGNAKAQDLIPELVINTEAIDPELNKCPEHYAYSNETNLLAFTNGYDLEILDITNLQVLLKTKALYNLTFFNKGQNFIAYRGKTINIYNTSNWNKYDSLIYNDLNILAISLSNDQSKLCALYKVGDNIYPEMKLVIWDLATKEIVQEKTINCEFDFQVTNKDEFVFLNMGWNENLNYLSFEWSLYTEVSTPFRSGRYFTKIYSLGENKMIKEYNHALNFIFDKYNNNAYYFEESYSSEGKYCLTKNLYTTVNLLTAVKSNFNFEFDQGGMASIQDYLIFTKSPCADEIFIINKENLQTKTFKTSYLHLQMCLSEDKAKLISSLANNPCKIAIYDITNITGVNDPIKGTVLYPNPTSHLLILELDNSLDYDIQIIEESGKILDSFPISNSYQLNYDTTKLPKGMYILQLNSKMSSKSYKFLKV